MTVIDPCTHCGKSTAFGFGRFINRVPSGTNHYVEDENGNVIYKEGEYREGYACEECLAIDCDRCGDPIPLDEDCSLDKWGEQRAHYECLTAEEKAKHDKENNNG